jgi:hypothetical protein
MKAAQPHGPIGHHHALVWIDHHEAKIFLFDSEISQAAHHVGVETLDHPGDGPLPAHAAQALRAAARLGLPYSPNRS